MKRWYIALAGLAASAAVFGAALSLTVDGSEVFRETLGRGLIAVSLLGMIVCAILRPRAAYTDAEIIGDGGLTQNGNVRCTFADVAANEEARRSLEQLRDYLLEPEKYRRCGARMPKGVLLYGPPGTGKTLLARALAGEANVPFFALAGSDFVEKYVGVGAKRVRDLFKRARKAGKCVIFIDEIDAMGKKRHDHSSDERDQTLNALLSEMSGFRSGEGVVVLAATNRMEMLDPALLRPGRFDRQIEVGLPGKRERLSILRLHSRGKPMGDDVNLERLAAQTAYYSGAALENILNEAAILAAENGETITMELLERALMRSMVGDERRCTATHRERQIIAVHEAGHALMIRALTPENRLTRVSILPASKGAAGYNLSIPPERVMIARTDLENQVCVLLAGRAAEMLAGGESAMTTGASNDLQRANEIVAAMVTELGMAGEPAVSLKALSGNGVCASDAAARCREMLSQMFARTQRLLRDNAEALFRLSDALMEHETLSGEDVDTILGHVSNDLQESTEEEKI